MKGLSLGFIALVLACASSARADGRERHAAPPSTPSVQLATANDASRRHPVSGAFQGARTVYTFESGALYQLYANPTYVSAILLEPGETLNSVAAGDTSRWMVTQAEGGIDGTPRAIVLVKPQAPGLRTNIVLITDRRTYLVEAISQAGPVYSAEMAWSYAEAVSQSATVSSVATLNFNYRVRTVRGATPHWMPTRVFDDGRKTWIEFGPGVASTDLPPLFVVTADGAELVNYRVEAGRYMVDRLFDVGELRLGSHAQVVVRIERNPLDRQRSRAMRRGPH